MTKHRKCKRCQKYHDNKQKHRTKVLKTDIICSKKGHINKLCVDSLKVRDRIEVDGMPVLPSSSIFTGRITDHIDTNTLSRATNDNTIPFPPDGKFIVKVPISHTFNEFLGECSDYPHMWNINSHYHPYVVNSSDESMLVNISMLPSYRWTSDSRLVGDGTTDPYVPGVTNDPFCDPNSKCAHLCKNVSIAVSKPLAPSFHLDCQGVLQHFLVPVIEGVTTEDLLPLDFTLEFFAMTFIIEIVQGDPSMLSVVKKGVIEESDYSVGITETLITQAVLCL